MNKAGDITTLSQTGRATPMTWDNASMDTKLPRDTTMGMALPWDTTGVDTAPTGDTTMDMAPAGT